MMLSVFDGDRFATNRAGLHIGWPMQGSGSFGDWSLGEVQTGKGNQLEQIEFVRALTPSEVDTILNQPVMYWFVLVHPKSGGTWALMRCRYTPVAHEGQVPRASTQVRRPDDLTDKVAV